MRTVRYTTQFKKDVKRAHQRGLDMEIMKGVIATLAQVEVLDSRFRDHALLGQYAGTRECHLQPDWLLIYRIIGEELVLVRTGSHVDLF